MTTNIEREMAEFHKLPGIGKAMEMKRAKEEIERLKKTVESERQRRETDKAIARGTGIMEERQRVATMKAASE